VGSSSRKPPPHSDDKKSAAKSRSRSRSRSDRKGDKKDKKKDKKDKEFAWMDSDSGSEAPAKQKEPEPVPIQEVETLGQMSRLAPDLERRLRKGDVRSRELCEIVAALVRSKFFDGGLFEKLADEL
ncbi:unnamed protein product, partial [Polarella glacialis]